MLGSNPVAVRPNTYVCGLSIAGIEGLRPAASMYKACSKKDRTFAIKTLLLISQHFKHCLL